jgi:hypothetical protein
MWCTSLRSRNISVVVFSHTHISTKGYVLFFFPKMAVTFLVKEFSAFMKLKD